ncbi:MAG: GTP-binding protein [Caldilineaceae bacterium SB0675_bin_29]|uniref:GTP-binding protein n=1 Tax=Caldilineaceae bacterium SB0675_bin_29 TaxID=2605266 RepID=A0A6B1FYN7_9CHLR|nr:GTP-binding protein [Caldilineaceae bacterium SB0675_bin_29]
MQQVLTAEQGQILQKERQLLGDLQVCLARLDAPDADLGLIRNALAQLEELFLMVVVGEFNAGKSAVINALLGQEYLAEGVVPTTSELVLIRHSDASEQPGADSGMAVRRLPVPWLQEVNLVDTPGTNAVIRQHQELTEHFVPRSDLVLFVTSADRPFSESERAFLQQIRDWGKKIVIVVNKIELLTTEAEQQEVLEFVRRNAHELLGVAPAIFAVSARLALEAKNSGESTEPTEGPRASSPTSLWQRSQFEPLEQYILDFLDAGERVRLQLSNPVGIAAALIANYQEVIRQRQSLLKGDFQALDAIDQQLAAYQNDMRRDFRYQSDRVDNVLYEMAERGDRFFDENLRITRVVELVNSERLRGEFERRVLADSSRAVERHVDELIDWLIERDYRQWQAVMEFIERRSLQHTDQMIGQVRGEFDFNRQNLLKSIGRSAQEVVDSYDREAEALKLAKDVQRAIIQTAAVEAGAIGLGAILVVILNTTFLDVTGVLGASALAALGLYVLPYRRQKVKAQLRARIGDLRRRLDTAITQQFESELTASVQRIREAVAPYTRFVRVEREKLETLAADLQNAESEWAGLRRRVEELAASHTPLPS